MQKNRSRLGFTMAEMLIVMAIIAVLGGVVFIAVQQHQRSLSQLECNTIAKEIFIAAQNHLTMTESQGYLSQSVGKSFFGTEETDAEGNSNGQNVYYIIGPSSGNILDQILPFGSIDETIRAGGSYLIRYQSNPAQVLDVFYCTKTGSPAKYNHTIVAADYSDFLENKGAFSYDYVVGWYGGVDPLANTDYGNYELKSPRVDVENGERLVVTITEPNKDITETDNLGYADVKLLITGETSKAEASIKLSMDPTNSGHPRFSYDTVNKKYIVVLDDITTAGLHFDELYTVKDETITFKKTVVGSGASATEETTQFIPGENITVQAVAYSNSVLTNIAYSNAITTNSLFADIDDTGKTAMIGSIRHLENLDANISHLDNNDEIGDLDIIKATQIDDLDWNDFVDELGAVSTEGTAKSVTIIPIDADASATIPDVFLPVYPSHWVGKKEQGTQNKVYSASDIALIYEGKAEITTTTKIPDPEDETKTKDETATTIINHSITGVQINGVVNAGLFGNLIKDSSVSNLELIDFKVTAIDEMEGQTVKTKGNAGALAGTLTGGTVTNVLARNSTSAVAVNITAASGSAGGLVGNMNGGTFQKSAAALIVSSTAGDAGGLIGKVSEGTVVGCYSGGHAIDKREGSEIIGVEYDTSAFDVTAGAAYAGGLIGDAGEAVIKNSYSTCSALGKYAGGLIGTGSGGSVTKCYATGLVSGIEQVESEATDENGQPTKIYTDTAHDGAFAYTYSGDVENCQYFETINERKAEEGNYWYLTALGENGTNDAITAFDADADTYNQFTAVWSDAKPYNPTLSTYYGRKYNLKSIKQLISEDGTPKVDDTDFVATHYGDWPAPEIFVINTASGS